MVDNGLNLCNLLWLGDVAGKAVVLPLKWSMEKISSNLFRIMVVDSAGTYVEFSQYILRIGFIYLFI